ncbi:MFS transporter [Subtercola sp. YIM 133946]|uniref:MFS transporter n=1 Tax=Subtercola sp. YIM 133946 TaxID=3118909 RepID=UPI002F9246DC
MSTDTIATTVGEFIDTLPVRRFQIQIAVLAGIVVLLDGLDNIVIGLVGPAMAASAGVKVAALSPVFSAGQFGFMAGALLIAPLGDRLGRKPVMIGAIALFGIMTVLTATADSVTGLLVLRFLTGVGMGGAAPVALALVAEYMPSRRRASTVAMVWAGFPLGGVVAGLVAPLFLPDWQLLFVLIGGVVVVVALILLWGIPESLGFLAARAVRRDRIPGLVHRLAPERTDYQSIQFRASEERSHVPVRQLFADRRAVVTIVLWAVFFCSFLPMVLISNWSPTILENSGLTVAEAGLAITFNSLGSWIGSGIVGVLMDHLGKFRVILIGLVITAANFVVLGAVAGNFAGAAIAIAALGFFAGGAQSGIITLGSLFYPTVIRSTGLGWAVALGRFGSAIGPLVGGAMIAAGWSAFTSFAVVAAFPIATLIMLVIVRLLVRQRPESFPAIITSDQPAAQKEAVSIHG